ncbi:hypothetical protein [Larkinella soli]|uniref:hypothetical protein n=1 Tax=Larkinella soli TaxID=1770527 RepID=UPI000FFC1204|nr:hypothetical protein [Larkinella soli]
MILFQQRDFGEKINATFQYAVQQARSLGAALLSIAGPVALLAGIGSGLMPLSEIFSRGTRIGDDYFGVIAPGSGGVVMLLTIFFSLLTTLFVYLTVYGHLKVYDRTQGGPVEVADVWSEVKQSLVGALGAAFISAVLIFVGMLFFLLPGIYFAVVFSLAVVVVVFENQTPVRFMGRCFDLIRDHWWSTFGLIIILSMITYILGIAFSLPVAVVSALNGMKVLPEVPTFVNILTSVISTVGSALVSSLMALALGFQYFNLVEKREGKGMLSAIESIGTAPSKTQSADEGEF